MVSLGFMTPAVDPQNPGTSLEELKRRRAWAEALWGSDQPIRHWSDGLSQGFERALGGFMAGRTDRQTSDLQGKANKDLGQALLAGQGSPQGGAWPLGALAQPSMQNAALAASEPFVASRSPLPGSLADARAAAAGRENISAAPIPPAASAAAFNPGMPGFRVPEQYRGQIERAAADAGVDPALYARLLYRESGFAPDVISGQRTSRAGAQGIAQFMPPTAREMGVDPLNPESAIPGGARYLAQQRKAFGSDALALMGYNWGPGRVQEWLKSGANPAQVPRETREYVESITGKPFETAVGGAYNAPSGAGAMPAAAGSAQPASNMTGGYRQAIANMLMNGNPYAAQLAQPLVAAVLQKEMVPYDLSFQQLGNDVVGLDPRTGQERSRVKGSSAEQDFTLGPGQRRFRGNQVIAEGPPQFQQGGQIPAEMGARIGLGDQFLSELPGIEKTIQEGGLNRFDFALGRGQAGEIWRRVETGREALIRNLTGAGMAIQEAQNQAARYQLGTTDTVETMMSKLEGLKRDLIATKEGALAARRPPSQTPTVLPPGVQQPAAGGQVPPADQEPRQPPSVQSLQPPPEAIRDLQADPSKEAQQEFDVIFGAGSAAQAMQKQDARPPGPPPQATQLAPPPPGMLERARQAISQQMYGPDSREVVLKMFRDSSLDPSGL